MKIVCGLFDIMSVTLHVSSAVDEAARTALHCCGFMVHMKCAVMWVWDWQLE